jgi:hypothetical protein
MVALRWWGMVEAEHTAVSDAVVGSFDLSAGLVSRYIYHCHNSKFFAGRSF